MKKTRISLMLVLILAFSALPFSLFLVNVTGTTTTLPDYEPLDLGFKIRDGDYELHTDTLLASSGLKASTIGEHKMFLALDDYLGYYFFTNYILMAEGEDAQVWVQEDISYPDGDPRPNPIITEEQALYLLGEFENNIIPTDSAVFGTPDTLDGSYSLLEAWGYFDPGYYYDEDSRNIILVSNVRDDAYYNPSYPYYIAGFYSPTFEAYFDRNIITIDTHDWENRMGPDVSRPYLYESIIAHEYQHLIHDDYFWQVSDDTFMNEACSQYAEAACGYPIDYASINRFLYTPDNSLTKWGDQENDAIDVSNILADYGAALLWSHYLSDHYGGDEFIGYFVQSGVPGIEGINAALDHFGYEKVFEDIFHDWRLANLIHSDSPGKGKYNYKTIDLSVDNLDVIQLRTTEIGGYYLPETRGTAFGTTTTYDLDDYDMHYDTEIAWIGPFGTDYYTFTDFRGLSLFTFNGDEIGVTVGWNDGGDYWYSEPGDLIHALIATEVPVPDVEGQVFLTLDTAYSLEEYWDYGFVQVALDGVGNWDSNWISLENSETTYDHDPSAHPLVIDNVPGLTGDYSGEPMTFDLSAYKGQTIHLGFRIVTDWAVVSPGWEIYSVTIGDDIHDYVGDLDFVYPTAKFMVSIVEKTTLPNGKNKFQINDMHIFDSHSDSNLGIDFSAISKWENATLIISPISYDGFTDYKISAWNLFRKCFGR